MVKRLKLNFEGANAEAIAYPIERLSRTNRTVLKTAVTEVGSGCPCGRVVAWS
jgi:hypothetical protein